MTKAFLKFPSRPVNYAPRIQSRRMGLRQFHNVAYREDGGDGGGETEEEKAAKQALLQKVNGEVNKVLEQRGIKEGTDLATVVQSSVKTALEGLPLEALRDFKPEQIQATVTKLAGQIEKMQQQGIGGAGEKLNALREHLMKKETMDKVEMVMRNRRGSIELEARAAVVMDTVNVVNDGDIPEDILNSYSVEAFIKKRRPSEYLFELINRRTIPKITEYKTWLEEGTEDGAFAVVAQGAVKPLVSKTLVRNVVKYRKVAGKRVYTEEFAKFRQEAYRILEDLFNDQLMRNYIAILTTSVLAAAASYVGTTLDHTIVAPTDFHAIGAVAAQEEALDFSPDLLIINPQDKWRMAMSQDSTGAFFMAMPTIGADGIVNLMGFRVVTSNRVTPGNFILGEAGLYKVEDEPVTVRMGYGITVTGSNPVTNVESDFDTNRFRIISELFMHNWIGTANAGSFVYASFASVKATLLKP